MSTPTKAARDAAVAKAAQTGVPQRVNDAQGKLAYYVDGRGNRTAPPLTALGTDSQGKPLLTGTDALPLPPVTSAGKAIEEQRGPAAASAAAAAKTAADAAAAAVATANAGYIWVDGHRMLVTAVDAHGNPTKVQYAGQLDANGNQLQPQAPPVQTAFAALDNSGVPDAKTQFTYSTGRQVDAQGNTVRNGWESDNSSSLHPDGVGPELGTNRMTIQNGVQWLANLSTTDKGAYQAQVNRLHDAGYLSDAQYASAISGWSSDAGLAYAYAARDTAVVNSTPNGANTSLTDLLAQKAAAHKEAAKKAYRPVDRSYTDPAAVVATAKSAAEAAIGRVLTDQEAAKLTSHYHSLEAAAYDQQDAVGRANAANPTGQQRGATTMQPNVGGQVDNFLSSGPLAQESADFHAAQMGDALRRLLGGPTL